MNAGHEYSRPPGDIQRIGQHRNPRLQQEHRRQPHQPADQRNQRHLVAMEADGLGRLFHRIRRVAIHAPPAVLARLLRGADQIARRIEFGQQAVSSFACGHSVTSLRRRLGRDLRPRQHHANFSHRNHGQEAHKQAGTAP